MAYRRSLLASTLVSLLAMASPALAVEKFERLPGNCQPESYELYIEPDLDNAGFEGSETLRFNLTASSSEIVLNSVDLSIYEASVAKLVKNGHSDWLKAEVIRDPEHERVTFKFPSSLSSGRYELALKFSGRLSKSLEGFYLSTFKDKSGKEQRLATTQMEPADARRMFPCLDEPSYKARFKVTVATSPELAVIANAGPEFEKIDQRRGKKIVSFKATPPMSTYLFALVVGPLKSTAASEVNGKKIRVWVPEGKETLAVYAQTMASKLLPYYESYFGQPYPLDKLDLIAIPDFSAGAMENLGAVTFRDTALLVDENKSALSSRMRVADVVAHEMAHLWFGDLVTMKWWDDLWLNEAFATWMAEKAVAELKPEWRLWDDFALERGSTLDLDSIEATRSVRSPVSSPSDALEMFDEITYSKGASLLRMLETYLGEERFRQGIGIYMKEHAFANASTNDLWEALSASSSARGKQKQAEVDVARLMAGWINNAGCPLLSFTSSSTSAAKGQPQVAIKLNQKRFYLDGRQAKDLSVWQVPLHISNGKDSQPALLGLKEQKVTVSLEPLFINGSGNGYFRTAFNADQIAKLKAADLLGLTVEERLAILSDLYALTISGNIGLDDYLTLACKFSKDQDRYVLASLMAQCHGLSRFVDPGEHSQLHGQAPDPSDKSRQAFEQYVRARFKPHLARLGFHRQPSDDDLTGSLRGSLISILGTIGQDPEVLAFCRSKFEDYLDGKLERDLLSPVVTVVAYNGDNEEFTRISEAWRKAESPEERNRNLFALAEIRHAESVERTLYLALGDEVKSQDAPGLLANLLSHPYSQQLAWKFVGEHWAEIEKKVSQRRLPHLIEACSSFSRPGQLEALKAFVAAHPLPSGRRAAAKTLELAAINTRFRTRAQGLPDVFARAEQ